MKLSKISVNVLKYEIPTFCPYDLNDPLFIKSHFAFNFHFFAQFWISLSSIFCHQMSKKRIVVKEKGHISNENENFQLVSQKYLQGIKCLYWRKEPTSTSVRTVPRKNLIFLFYGNYFLKSILGKKRRSLKLLWKNFI